GTDLFLSGRSRHTSSDRDWSSDVCSSDLCTPGCAAGAVLPGEDSPGSASGCALTIRFIEPWRYSSTSRERCRATAENPIFCSKAPNSCGWEVAYSMNSIPSSPSVLLGAGKGSWALTGFLLGRNIR